MYADPAFRVELNKAQSQWMRQERGIGQGCLQSRCMLLIAISTVWFDIGEALRHAGEQLGIVGVDAGAALCGRHSGGYTRQNARAVSCIS